MEIREVREDELQQSFYLGSQAFRNGERDDNWAAIMLQSKTRRSSTTYGVWDSAGLQAKVIIVHFRQHFGEQLVLPMGGIAGVACLPASRGKGYAGACLHYALERMRENGEVVSTLFPFSWAFYRKLGWEWVGVNREYSVLTRNLKSDPQTERVRAATTADRPAILDAYTAFARRYRGMLERDEREWTRRLDDGEKEFTFTYVYEHDGKVEGYLTFRGGKRENTRISEFIVLTPQAQRAMLGLLRRHEMQVDKFTWAAPDDDPLWSQYYHWDITTKLEPVVQGRVVDVVGAFRALKPAPSIRGSVVFSVQDESAPWNAGVWKADCEAGEVSLQKTADSPQVSLDIQALSQAYYGAPNTAQLRRAERLTVHEEAGYEVLQRILAGPPMWLNDHF